MDRTGLPVDSRIITEENFRKYKPDVCRRWARSVRTLRYPRASAKMTNGLPAATLLSRVDQVIPYDGKLLHVQANMAVICNGWVFNFQQRMWLPEHARVRDCEALRSTLELMCEFKSCLEQTYEMVCTNVAELYCYGLHLCIIELEALHATLEVITQRLLRYFNEVVGKIIRHGELPALVELKRDQVVGWVAELERQKQHLKSLKKTLATL